MVQTRWGHLNADTSALTRAQALMLDGYAEEQVLRCERGLLPVFNGSAGLWNRECIVDAGGWSGRTLSDDLDLSYRAQLAGGRSAMTRRCCRRRITRAALRRSSVSSSAGPKDRCN